LAFCCLGLCLGLTPQPAAAASLRRGAGDFGSPHGRRDLAAVAEGATKVASDGLGAGQGAGAIDSRGAGTGAVGANGSHVGAAAEVTSAAASAATALAAEGSAAVDAILFGSTAASSGRSPLAGLGTLVARGAAQLDLGDALREVKAPASVVALVHGGMAVGRQQPATASPEEVTKAVGTLNSMALKAQERLDQKVVECHEFREKNLATTKQVAGDLSRLGQQIANAARVLTSTLGSMEEISTNAQQAKEEQEREYLNYQQLRKVDEAQYKERQQDLLVAESMLNLTQCKGGVGLLQRRHWRGAGAGAGADGGARGGEAAASTGFQACFGEENGAGPELLFKDPRLESSASKLTAEGRRLLQLAMSRAELLAEGDSTGAAAALRAAGLAEDYEDGDEAEASAVSGGGPLSIAAALAAASRATLSTQAQQAPSAAAQATAPPPPAATQTVDGPVDSGKQANRCVMAEPDCGVLHDLFASLWGEMKDLVDESMEKLHEDDQHWKVLSEGTNAQLQSLATQKGELQSALAEATSTKAALQEQQENKQAESREIRHLGTSTLMECRSTVRHILFTEICGIVRVRNELITTNLDVKSEEIVDCQIGEWVPSECSVACDDTMQGGVQLLRREVLTRNTKWGATCANLTLTTRCNQVRCPIDCALSDWSSWSQCTKECGGGVETRTRSQLTKPKYGGHACDSLQDARPCNSGSCDRNCKLGDWTEFSPCSKACDTGYIERQKHVMVRARGSGVCPKENSHHRNEKKTCNEQACIGDELCMAKMDLIIAIDGSGSLTAKGFDVLKAFAAKLVRRFRPKAYGREAVRVGVVQFGNGKLDANKVVSDAILVTTPTDNMEEAAGKIEALKWQRGFTNMAQAVLKSKDMLTSNSRNGAQSVVMLLTDGRPTFKHQATSAVEELRSSARFVIIQVQQYTKVDSVKLLKSWASRPWQTNYVHIPGKKALKGAYDQFATQVVAQLCTRAESPSTKSALEEQQGFRLIREMANCGEGQAVSSQDTVDNCFLFAEKTAPGWWKTFSYGDGVCMLYPETCPDYLRNSSYAVYERVATVPGLPGWLAMHARRPGLPQGQLLSGPRTGAALGR